MSAESDVRWKRGDRINWIYREPAAPETVDLRPVTVVADDDRHLAVWLAPGTRMLYPVLGNGQEIRSLSGPEQFSGHLAQAVRTWKGEGVLAVFQPDTMYSVWFFESDSGLRDSYYVNIENPPLRSEAGVESRDLVLDLLVDADGTFQYKDQDELEFALEAGLFDQDMVSTIRAAALDAIEVINRWGFPFNAGYETFVPSPDWGVPQLPATATWDFEK